MYQPHTNNYLSYPNSRAADFMLEAQSSLHDEGLNVTFDVTYDDGVSFDSKSVKNLATRFPWGVIIKVSHRCES